MIQRFLPKSDFAKNTFTLMTGTSIAQAIPIMIAPILTRVFSPEDFGTFGLFMALFSTLSVIATLRYAYAIVLPKSKTDGMSLVLLSIIISGLLSIFIMILIVVFNEQLVTLLKNMSIGKLLYFLPLSILFFGIFQSLSFWCIRIKKYNSLAISKVSQTSSMAITQIIMGLLNLTYLGLVLGYVIGQICSLLTIIFLTIKKEKDVFTKYTKLKILANGRKYSDYPKYTAFPSLLDSFTLQLPIFFLTKAYELSTVGFFALTLRVLAAPASIISTSISKVYLKRIADIANEDPSLLKEEVINTFQKLLALSGIIFLPIIVFGQEIFQFIFGKEWVESGKYAQYLSIPLAVRFFVSPLSSIFGVTNNTKLAAIWKIGYFCTTVFILFIVSNFSFDIFLKAFIVNEVIVYLIYLMLILYASNNYQRRVKM